MQFKSMEEIQAKADVIEPGAMTKAQKRERWAKALQERGSARLRTLSNIEYVLPARRMPMRENNSPLTVAFEDPVLRAAGLTGDTYGEALNFFEYRHGQMHKLVCRCHLGTFVSSEKLAQQVSRTVQTPFALLANWARAVGTRMGFAR